MGVLRQFIQKELLSEVKVSSLHAPAILAIPATLEEERLKLQHKTLDGQECNKTGKICEFDPYAITSQPTTDSIFYMRNIVRDEERFINLKEKDPRDQQEELKRVRKFCFDEHVRLFRYAPIPLSGGLNDREMLACCRRYLQNDNIEIVDRSFRNAWESARNDWFTEVRDAADALESGRNL